MSPELRRRIGPFGLGAALIVVLAFAVIALERKPQPEAGRTTVTSAQEERPCPTHVTLQFRENRAAASAGDAPLLDRMAECLISDKVERIDLGGLGVIDEPRARDVAEQLASRGVAPGLLARVTYADGQPLCRPGDESCWAANRQRSMP
jgi:hypothetical protein